MKHWTVSEVARMAHVTVRTLHHYDEIGLLVPSQRTEAGYRLYGESDVERLHQVLLYRELGLQLDGIARLLDEPAMSRRAALQAQRAALLEKQRRTAALIRAVDRRLGAIERGEKMSTRENPEDFEGFDAPEEIKAQQAKHEREVRERWGATSAYEESMRRVRAYSKQDWGRIKEEAEGIEGDMAALLRAGKDPASAEAMAVAERARQHITRFYYDCSPSMHAGLADMYEADPRFAAHYEQRAKGLAAFTAAAIRANGRRAEEESKS